MAQVGPDLRVLPLVPTQRTDDDSRLDAPQRPVAEATSRGGQSGAFRPDVEGLRAIAVVLVVLYHAGVPGIRGGYVGVDVFFGLSGFLITGLLLREREKMGRTSLLAFYARRARRILPAATLVLLATVAASYHWLGFLRAGQIARDGQYAALFAANFHFSATATNYLTALAPPSPLQHFWSLAVEEQFYFLWPGLFVVTAVAVRRLPRLRLRPTLVALLGTLTIASLAWSVHLTAAHGNAAFFSPFTRAWELSAGALVAVAAPALLRIPSRLGAGASWLGLAGICMSAVVFSPDTRFPGYAALLPVLATALAIAGGTCGARGGAQGLIGRPPFQWLGKCSYSLYLWHWPLLMMAAQHAGHSLPWRTNLLLAAAAVVASALTLVLLENPVRHARWLCARPLRSLALALVLVLAGTTVSLLEVHTHPQQHRQPAAPADPSKI